MLRAFNAIQNLSNSERGLTRGAMRQLCISTVFSVSDYGSKVWFRNQLNFVKDIQTIQNNAMRRIADAFKTTSIKALEAEVELMSTKQRLFDRLRKYAIRMLHVTNTHNVRQCIDNYENAYEDEDRIDTQTSYVMKTLQQNTEKDKLEKIEMFTYEPWYESKINIHIEQTTKEDETTKHQSRKFDKTDLVLYTDGSMLNQNV